MRTPRRWLHGILANPETNATVETRQKLCQVVAALPLGGKTTIGKTTIRDRPFGAVPPCNSW
jgi:hypothetical protein